MQNKGYKSKIKLIPYEELMELIEGDAIIKALVKERQGWCNWFWNYWARDNEK